MTRSNRMKFRLQKREFSLLLNISRPSYSRLGYNRTITRTNILTFCSTLGQGRGEEGKKEVKKATFPTLLTMIVVNRPL